MGKDQTEYSPIVLSGLPRILQEQFKINQDHEKKRSRDNAFFRKEQSEKSLSKRTS